MTNIKSFKSFIVENDSSTLTDGSNKSVTNLKAGKKADDIGNVGFDQTILQIGFGAVGQDLLSVIIKHVAADPKKITVIEKDDHGKHFRKYYGGSGVKYIKKEINKGNLESTLKKYLKPGGFLIDVSVDIDVKAILKWCFENDVMYINTSMERWPSKADEDIKNLSDRTLFHTHNDVREFAKSYPNAATAACQQGMNPGSVSHFAKRALLLIAEKKKIKYTTPTSKEEWAQLMKKIGVDVIQISERDSQIIDKSKEVNEFVNSWSVAGAKAEMRAPSEFGYGTAETGVLEDGEIQGPAAFFNKPGVSVLVKGYVPLSGTYNGFLLQHSESITMSQYFETEDKSYRPSVYYCYLPTDACVASIHEFRSKELDITSKERIVKDEILKGIDELGVLMICKDTSYWYGSRLDINRARELVPGSNATTVQVVGNMLGTIIWAIQNPRKGYIEPEDTDYEFILKYADPYLEPLVFLEVDWRPEEVRTELFDIPFNKKKPNCIQNYLVTK